MAMTLRLSKSEQQQFKKAAKREGLSMQVAARTALREWVVRNWQRDEDQVGRLLE